MNQTITLVMIVRDEETVLPRCLESVKNAVDEIVIVDTGSQDRTVEAACRYTTRVYHYQWNDDFAAARNFALARAGGCWVLSLDADETLDSTDGDLRSLAANQNGHEAFFLPLYNQGDARPGQYHYVLRFFRNNGYRFQGSIHEQVTVTHPDKVGVAKGPLIRHHVAGGRERNRKRERNLRLLQRATSEIPGAFRHYYLGVEWLALGRPELALPCLEIAYQQLTDAHLQFRLPALHHLITCLTHLNQLDRATCLCLEESRHYPFYSDIFFAGGLLFETKGEFAVAMRWFQEALNCGRPPDLFYHVEGVEGFLSYYHLGHCCEQMGDYRRAADYYQQALAANPDYIHPLCSLFLLTLMEKGAGYSFEYFRASGYLSHLKQAALLAGLFFQSGYPDLASACLKLHGEHLPPPLIRSLARYYLYAGRPQKARLLIDRLRAAGEEESITMDEIVSLLIEQDYSTSRNRALSLWRRPARRSEALALLTLIALMEKGNSHLRPEAHREAAVVQTVLTVVQYCFYAFSVWGNEAAPYRQLAERAIRWLADLSPASCAKLCNFLTGYGNGINKLAVFKFGPAGGLWPCPTDRPSAFV